MATYAAALSALSDPMIHASLRGDAEIYRRAKRVALFNLAFILWIFVFAVIYFALGSPRCALVTLWCTLPMLVSLVVLERGASIVIATNWLIVGGTITLAALSYLNGGSSGSLLWFTCAPVVAALTCGILWGLAWTAVSLVVIAAMTWARYSGVSLPAELDARSLAIFEFAALVGLVACQLSLAAVRVGVEQRAQAALHEANRRLSQARKDLKALRDSFGFSIEEWEKLKREKAALEYAVSHRWEDAPEHAKRPPAASQP